jgi:two-component system, OmpR family, KDP operon response regulator KdpE
VNTVLVVEDDPHIRGTPIIVLSGRTGAGEKVAALDAGADDYVTKPFGTPELLARLRAARRRVRGVETVVPVRLGDLAVDLTTRTVTSAADGSQLQLTPTEWDVLEILARNPGRLISHAELTSRIWGKDRAEAGESLRAYLARLRRKLEPDPARPRYLLTEPGMGYRFQA